VKRRTALDAEQFRRASTKPITEGSRVSAQRAAKGDASEERRADATTKPNAARRNNSIRSAANYVFLPGMLTGWLALPCESLYAEPPDFGLSALGFLASLLPLS
jgi:hypothetical protein